jgi:hypothetical protein
MATLRRPLAFELCSTQTIGQGSIPTIAATGTQPVQQSANGAPSYAEVQIVTQGCTEREENVSLHTVTVETPSTHSMVRLPSGGQATIAEELRKAASNARNIVNQPPDYDASAFINQLTSGVCSWYALKLLMGATCMHACLLASLHSEPCERALPEPLWPSLAGVHKKPSRQCAS